MSAELDSLAAAFREEGFTVEVTEDGNGILAVRESSLPEPSESGYLFGARIALAVSFLMMGGELLTRGRRKPRRGCLDCE